MYLRNTFDVFSSNFNLTYKLLAYKIILAIVCVAIGFASIAPFLEPLIANLSSAGVFEMTSNLLARLETPTVFDDSINYQIFEIFNMARMIFIDHASNLASIYALLALLVFIWYLASSAVDIAICEAIHFFCKQKTKRSFFACFISKIVDTCKYTLFKLLLILPLELFVFALSISVVASNIFGIFSSMIGVIVFFSLMPIKGVLSSCFVPCLVQSKNGVFHSFKKGCALACKKFGKVYSSFLFLMIVEITVITASSILTLGAITPFVLVCFTVYFHCFSMVLYYNLEGVRFYANSETIITPYRVKIKEGDYTIDML